MPILTNKFRAKMAKVAFSAQALLVVVRHIAMFRGSSERPLRDVSDEPMYAFIWHLLINICQIEKKSS